MPTPHSALRTPHLALGRRACLRSLVGGSLLLPAILSELSAADAPLATSADPADPLAPKAAAFSRQGEAGDLHLLAPAACRTWTRSTTSRSSSQPTARQSGVGGGLSNQQKPLVKPRWEFQPGGKCGTLVSDLFPHIRERMDDICLIRSMKSRRQRALPGDAGDAHRLVLLHAAEHRGLAELRPGDGEPESAVVHRHRAAHCRMPAAQVWGNDFLPAYHQGTRVVPGAEPIPNLAAAHADRRACRSWSWTWPRRSTASTSRRNGNDSDLAARIRSFETAFHMQTAAPEAFDLAQETDETLELYGLKRGDTRELRLAVPGRPPAGRARRAVHRADRPRLERTTGTRTATWPARAAGQGDRPADRRAAAGPEAARHARRHAGGLDDRVRPHAGAGRRRRAAATTARASRRGWPAAA